MKNKEYEGIIESIAKSLYRDKKGISVMLSKNLILTKDTYSISFENEDILINVKFIKKEKEEII